MTISEAIKEIIKLKGLVVFDDYKKFMGMLVDLSKATQEQELKVFKHAVDDKMLKLCVDDTLENNRKILKLQIQLENQGLSQDWINFIIESFALPLGWNYTPRKVTQQVQPQQNQQIKQVQNQNNSSTQTEWTCSCGAVSSGNFCSNCGKPKPIPKKSNDWICSCGAVSNGNFCSNCGKPNDQNIEEARRRAEEEARRRAEEEARRKAEEEARRKAEEEARRKAEEEARRKAEEARRRAEEARRRAEEARRRAEEARRNPLKNARIGDYIKFGNYPQTATGEIQPIEWLVLARKIDKILVISRYGLEARRFDSDSNDWKNSEIRQWLNNDFYNKAFNANEKKLIRNSSISTPVLKRYKSVFGGFRGKSYDKVFLLSKEEAEKYFANYDARRCKATKYAVKNGAFVETEYAVINCVHVNSNIGYSWCYLRSPVFMDSRMVYGVFGSGCVGFGRVNDDSSVVRPAMWISIFNLLNLICRIK